MRILNNVTEILNPVRRNHGSLEFFHDSERFVL